MYNARKSERSSSQSASVYKTKCFFRSVIPWFSNAPAKTPERTFLGSLNFENLCNLFYHTNIFYLRMIVLYSQPR